MDLENRLSELLETSVGGLQPPVAEMVVEANRLGGRRRARTRIQLGAAVVAVAAVATAGTVIGLDRRQPGPVTEVVAAAPGTAKPAPAATPTPTSTPTPTPTPTEPATAQVTWQAMLKILADSLPPGGTFGNLDLFMKGNGSSQHSLQVEYNDGHGASTVMVDLRQSGPRTAMITCATWGGGMDEGSRPAGAEPISCAEKTLPDGSHLFSYVTGADMYHWYDEGVVLTHPNGDVVQITAANGVNNAYGHVPTVTMTRPKPPVGIAGWETIVQNPLWQTHVTQSLVDAGAQFAKGVSRMPCPEPGKPSCAG